MDVSDYRICDKCGQPVGSVYYKKDDGRILCRRCNFSEHTPDCSKCVELKMQLAAANRRLQEGFPVDGDIVMTKVYYDDIIEQLAVMKQNTARLKALPDLLTGDGPFILSCSADNKFSIWFKGPSRGRLIEKVSLEAAIDAAMKEDNGE